MNRQNAHSWPYSPLTSERLPAALAQLVASSLVAESIWFECEPQPNDTFQITVKVAAHGKLLHLIKVAQAGAAILDED